MLGTLIGAVRDALGMGMRLRIDSGTEPSPHVLVMIGVDDWPEVPAVRVRYDPGRLLPENGDELARLLTELVSRWPVDVERITLVGRSLGGLLAQHAVRSPEAVAWSDLVVRVLCFVRPDADRPGLRMWSLRAPSMPSVPSVPNGVTRITSLDERDWLPIDPARALSHPPPTVLRDPAPPTRPARWIGDLLVVPHRPDRTLRAFLGRIMRRVRARPL